MFLDAGEFLQALAQVPIGGMEDFDHGLVDESLKVKRIFLSGKKRLKGDYSTSNLSYILSRLGTNFNKHLSGIGRLVGKMRGTSSFVYAATALLFFLFLVLSSVAVGQTKDSVLIQKGPASFYGKRFHLKMTSNGEVFHMDSLTAAHKYLPYDTWVKVTRVDTKDSVWVRINDRLPKAPLE